MDHVVSSPPIKIIALIPALDTGGTERQLIELVRGIDKSRFIVHVGTFYGAGALQPEVEQIPGVHLFALKEKRTSRAFLAFFRLWLEARRIRPDVMIGYLNLPAILCSFVGKQVGAGVMWCLRSSEVDYARYGRGMRWSFKAGAYLSRFADRIIFNSVAGETYHRAKGYRTDRVAVIPNGIDTARFRPMPESGVQLRAKWGVKPDEMLIGLVGRLDYMKDHPTFLRAAAKVVAANERVRFVCVGGGAPDYAAQLKDISSDLDLNDHVIWAGDQHDMIGVYNALDFLVSSSSGEGFSNVIAEAMASGVPAVVTDVGDSALIVGETGMTFPRGDDRRLAAVLLDCVTMNLDQRRELQRQARDRIVRLFNVEAMVTRMQNAIEELMKSRPTPNHLRTNSRLTLSV